MQQVEKTDHPVLRQINVKLMPKDLLLVVGKIGSGKTSFLHSLMNETEIKSGNHSVRGSIAYVEQEPFICSGTVKQNICFGLQYAETRFRKAITAAQLDTDLDHFTHGWNTMLGAKGINISSSIKTKISLARAIYQDADIYLLDDPLSVVNTNMANIIFNQAIKGPLANKCVVLVTQQLQFLKRVDKILVLQNGRQAMYGNFEQITDQGFDMEEIKKQCTKG